MQTFISIYKIVIMNKSSNTIFKKYKKKYAISVVLQNLKHFSGEMRSNDFPVYIHLYVYIRAYYENVLITGIIIFIQMILLGEIKMQTT